MIYYNDEPVIWSGTKELTDLAKSVRDEITQIKNKFFGTKNMGKVVLLYPKGKPKEKDNGFTIMKIFPIPLTSSDGMWRYSSSKKNNKGEYVDSHVYIKNAQSFTEKNLEFIWFLLNRSSVLNKYIFVEDKEGEAKKENEKMATDAYIRYMLMDKRSPVANDKKTIEQVAEIFGVPNVEKRGIEELKKDLYTMLVKGQENNDKFCNYDKFDEFVGGEIKRKAAFYARQSINDGTVGYKDYAWHLMAGREFDEKLCSIDRKEASFKEQAFIDTVVNNASVRSRLFKAIGQEEYRTCAELWDLDRPVLQRKAKDELGIFDPKLKAEDLVKKLCEHYGIEFTPKP